MTMFKPSLFVDELAIFKEAKEVFRAKFHKGVNIVKGHNSSGKTTILDFLAYTMGAENIPWKPYALLCDTSIAQISLNGRAITIRRDVNQKIMNPMYIYWGDIKGALQANFSEWEIFPFKRSTSKISFTQALLLALDLSEAQGDGASNLTMHQFLRVLYADQPSLHSPIFRVDNFDSALTRDTVGNYLCGIYDDNLYSAQLEKRELDKQITSLTSELKSIFSVLARSGQDISLDFFQNQITSMEKARSEVINQLSVIKTERVVRKSNTSNIADINLRKNLDKAKSLLFNEQDRLTTTELQLADTNKFVKEVKSRLKNIDESNLTRQFFGNIEFTFCPCCLTEIKSKQDDKTECSLCKNTSESSAADGQVLRMKNELRIQLQESQVIQLELQSEATKLISNIPALKQNLKRLESLYIEATNTWSTDMEAAIEGLSRQIGGCDQEIKTLYESQKLALVIQELQSRKELMQARMIEIDSIIEKLEFSQHERQKVISLQIVDTLGKLLRKDMYRQEEFKEASSVTFSFSDNEITVNGATKFSESSTVVLRHLFHISLLSAAANIPMMRLPRFMILDGIEDGGMELPRGHLLQEIIVEECNTFETDFQLIFATSQIAPSLDNKDYVVGRSFSEESRSLNIM
ncbi:MAG: hypothetical protein PSV17_04225 [Methylotenera sp.]|uniref:hypothetical protein n=1 Tax=Methylotenera sp. TaxID=2051956 RepID=UPI00248735DD|nr:hypothetical protein [Methylotenera sp.]MDI1308625.1 hypothetical protein [Methylotenera sp.]